MYKKFSNHGKFDVRYALLKEGTNDDDPTFTTAHTVDGYNATALRNVHNSFTISSLDADSTYGIVFQVIGNGQNASSSGYYKLMNQNITLVIKE